MTYRADIIWIDSTAQSSTILMLMKKHKNISYFPVCAGNLDAVIGLLSARDYLQSRLDMPSAPLRTMVTEPLFIPESQTVERTIALLTARREGAACVINEYGGIEGFVTKYGLLEVLFTKGIQPLGAVDSMIITQADGSLLIKAHISLDEVRSLHILEGGAGLPEGEYYTLAGYILAHISTIPHEGDVIAIGDCLCTIVSMKGHRIDQVLIRKKDTNRFKK